MTRGEQIREVYKLYPRLINEKKFDEISTMLAELDLDETDDTILVCHLVSAHWCYLEVEPAYRVYYDRLEKYFSDQGKDPESILTGLDPTRLDKKYKTPTPEQKWLTGLGDTLSGVSIDRNGENKEIV